MAEHLILKSIDPKEYQKVKHDLNGPFLTIGPKPTREQLIAPYWWQGDDEAYNSTMKATQGPPRRRSRRR